ncbi:MAG: spore coat protein [Sphingobium sp.]|jgi:spore coat protein U-like protein|nr:MAG: spore coat protein [Sphingobium sp.]
MAGAALCPTASGAQTVTGTVGSTITLTAACQVNGSTATSGVNFGTLDFGSRSTLFNTATGVVDGNGAGAIAIQCTPGSGATLTVVGGAHDAAITGGNRALSNGTKFVPYDIYRDAGYANVLANGATISVTTDGTVQTIPIYGRAVGTSALVAGTYTDTISLTLTF